MIDSGFEDSAWALSAKDILFFQVWASTAKRRQTWGAVQCLLVGWNHTWGYSRKAHLHRGIDKSLESQEEQTIAHPDCPWLCELHFVLTCGGIIFFFGARINTWTLMAILIIVQSVIKLEANYLSFLVPILVGINVLTCVWHPCQSLVCLGLTNSSFSSLVIGNGRGPRCTKPQYHSAPFCSRLRWCRSLLL